MNPYIKSKLTAKTPGAHGQLTASDFGELALSCLKRRQDAPKADIGHSFDADTGQSLIIRRPRIRHTVARHA